MRVHFTNLFGQSSRSVALIAQNDTMKIAKELGANELGIYFYDSSQEPDGELNSRFDGIVAGLSVGDMFYCKSLLSKIFNSLVFRLSARKSASVCRSVVWRIR